MRDDQVVEVMRRANPVDARTDLGQTYGESWDDALAVLIAGRSGRAADIARVKPLVDVRAGRGWLIAAAAAALVVIVVGGVAFLASRSTAPPPVLGDLEPASSTGVTTPVEQPPATVPGTDATAPPEAGSTPNDLDTVLRFIELGWGGDPDAAMAMVDLDPDLLVITTNSLPFQRTILDLTSPATNAQEGEDSPFDQEFFGPFDPVPKDVAETMIGAVLGAATTLDTSVTDIDCTLDKSFEELAVFTPRFVACTARVESRLTAVLPAIPAPSSEGDEPDLPDYARWFAFVADAGKVTGVVALPAWSGAVDSPDELTPYAERFARIEQEEACPVTLESAETCVDFWLGIADGFSRIRDILYEPFEFTDGDLRFVFSEFFWAEYDHRSSVTIYENGVLIGGGTMYNLYGEGSDPADHYIFWDPAAARDVPLALRDRTVVLRGSVLDAVMAALLES